MSAQTAGWHDQPAAVLSIPSADVEGAIADPARADMTDGPAKDLLAAIAAHATGDYDPGDVIVLVVRPPARSNLR